ncbi:MAG: signal peptidase I [Deltaproteobacteria bacterium]|nr:signal peptidase I [Deltaproteobacteria bacterium]
MSKARSSVTAVLLNLPLPGLGQLYCGRPLWALLFLLLHFSGWVVFFAGFVGGGWELQSASRAAVSVFVLALLASSVHVVFAARRAGDDYQLKSYNLWYFYLLVWLVAGMGPTFGMFNLVRTRLVTTLPLMSDGMHPTLLMGDRLRLDRRSATQEALVPGDLVAVVDPLDKQTLRVLRLVATGGQRVVLGPDGLSVDGKSLQLGVFDNVDYERRRADGQWRTVTCSLAEEGFAERRWRICQSPDLRVRRKLDQTVPEGSVFLLGDNRLHAKDSGDFGAVPKEDLLGRIFQVRYSIDPKSKTLRAERKGIEIP